MTCTAPSAMGTTETTLLMTAASRPVSARPEVMSSRRIIVVERREILMRGSDLCKHGIYQLCRGSGVDEDDKASGNEYREFHLVTSDSAGILFQTVSWGKPKAKGVLHSLHSKGPEKAAGRTGFKTTRRRPRRVFLFRHISRPRRGVIVSNHVSR